MNNDLKIFYNNIDIFSGIAPTPFISSSQDFIDFNTNWNQVTNLTLNGQITGQYIGNFSFGQLSENANTLLNRLNENFKSFKIVENSEVLYSAPVSIIDSINFEESNWYGILPFSIQIKVYESGLFSNYYGIVEPEEDFSFSEENSVLNLNHRISAKGIQTSGKNSIQNAKNWVLSRTGEINKVRTLLVKNNSNSFLLTSTNETIDRFNGTYSIENIYSKQTHRENLKNAFLNYSIDINSGINDQFLKVSLNGSLEKNNISILRQEYNKLNLFDIANNACNGTFKENLSARPVFQSVEELPNENKLTFSIIYNNDFDSEIINDYNVDIRTDSLTCINTISLNAQISCKYGDIKTKWEKVLNYFNTQFFPNNIVRNEYIKEFPGGTFNQNPITESISFNEFNGVITYNAQYNDKAIISQDLISLTCNVNLTPSIFIHAANASAFITRAHNVQNLDNANRTKLTIQVRATAKIDKNISIAERLAKDQINIIKNNYIGNKNPVLEDSQINRNSEIKSVDITETYSYEGDIIL
jgi:hypothetical protein